MIARYTRPKIGAIWSDQHKYECWLEVELAAAEALAELGEVPKDAARSLRDNAAFDLRRIQEIEAEVRHDVIAFTTAVAERSEEHTSELQSPVHLVCRLLLEKIKTSMACRMFFM